MSTMHAGNESEVTFSGAERDAVYKCIFNRRDVRSQFLPDPVPEDVLARILRAAHHAPSVGFMQPWDFIVVRDAGVKQRIHEAFFDETWASYVDLRKRGDLNSI